MSKMSYINYDELSSKIAQASPSSVHSKNTILFQYFYRYLLTDLMSLYKLENAPESWDIDYFFTNLFNLGYLVILNTNEYGVIPQTGTLSNYNVYRKPNRFHVANPLLKNHYYDLVIDKDCALIKLQYDYQGLATTLSYYADLLSLVSTSTGVNLINSKLSYLFIADGKANAESFKKIYDKMQSGEPAIFTDKKMFSVDGSKNWDYFLQNVSDNFIADKLEQLYNSIMNQFRTEVGIPNSNFDKPERALVDEVANNSAQTNARALMRLNSIQKGLDVANKLFNLDVQIKYNFDTNQSRKEDDSDE